MYTLQCSLCGKDFESKQPTAKFCKNQHYKDCPVCGVEIAIKRPKRPPRTCSASCNAQLELKTGEPNHVCELCGDKYYSKNPRSRFCNKEHTKNCIVCDRIFVINNHKPASTCSKKCASMIIDREKADAKYKKTVLEKYGVENVSQIDDVKAKKRQRAQERYGVDNVSQASEVKEKRNETMNRLYGGYGLASDILGSRIRKTIKEKYGVDSLFQNEDIKKRSRETFMRKYGVPHWGLVGKMDSKKIEEWENLEDWLKSFDTPPTLMSVSSYFNVDYVSVLYNMERNRISRTLVDFKHSISEQEFIDYLSKNHEGLFYVCNERNIIPPKEVDFFFPDLGIAVEISPSATHHSNPNHQNSYLAHRAKPSSYHQDKFISCLDNSVILLTYFDWMQWSDFCQTFSLLVNNLSTAQKRFFDCRTIEESDGRNFLNKHNINKVDYRDNHFVGFFDRENNMVGVCSFRIVYGNTIEIHRISCAPGFSSSANIKYVASYLLQNNKNITKIRIESSNNTNILVSLYEGAGFKQISTRSPILRWVHPTKRRENGNIWAFKQFALGSYGIDSVLKNFPNHEPLDREVPPEESCAILENLGFLPVYDCGVSVWEFVR